MLVVAARLPLAKALVKDGKWEFDQASLLFGHALSDLQSESVPGALVHTPGHWAALRWQGGSLWLLDSLKAAPSNLGPAPELQCHVVLGGVYGIYALRRSATTVADAAPELPGAPQQLAADSASVCVADGGPDEGPPQHWRATASGAGGLPSEHDPAAAPPHQAEGAPVSMVQHGCAAGPKKPPDAVSDAAMRCRRFHGEGAQPGAHQCDSGGGLPSDGGRPDAHQRGSGMTTTASQCRDFSARLHADATQLLDIFVREGAQASLGFLQSLPDFVTEGALDSAAHSFELAAYELCKQRINSVAALEVVPAIADTLSYRMAVLLQATSRAEGLPAVFYVDVLHSLLHSVLHKSLHVKLGRWASKSRHWMCGTANAGEGKSPAMKPLAQALERAMQRLPASAIGEERDRWHFQQSGTTAAAVDKVHDTGGYLCLLADEAGRCLCLQYASGGATDPHKFVDLLLFLNAAHGEEVSHVTKHDRMKSSESFL